MKTRKVTLLIAAAVLTAGGAFAQTVAPASAEGMNSAIRDAIEIASMNDDRMVFRCEGNSMAPFFGPGSVALARKSEFEALRPGTIAIYRDRSNDLVAHRVVSLSEKGWTARGQNNRRIDDERVTPENFVGIVYAVFHTAGQSGSDVVRAGEIPVVIGKSR